MKPARILNDVGYNNDTKSRNKMPKEKNITVFCHYHTKKTATNALFIAAILSSHAIRAGN
ncbi:hypothetical protein AYY16_17770 [Morganella psychrotolerans]|nr:hypothetical protein AYY16_17770 [Morganella psychrotolerans]